MTNIWDTLVIGGGQSGLAAGYHLQRRGLQYLILEANEKVTGSWPHQYDSLKLFSPARFSSLPDMNFPVDPNKYPLKDEVVRYLQLYKEHYQLPVRTGELVNRVEKEGEVFKIQTKSGNTYLSKTVIHATGNFSKPYIPVIKDHETFQGRTLHSSQYKNPSSFSGKRVIIVGRRNSAVQIGVELAEVSKTTLAVRQPVQLVNQKLLGQDVHFWVKVTGFDSFPFWRLGKTVPIPGGVTDLGDYQNRLDKGKPDQKPMFSSFYTNGVTWSDGAKEPVDSVIFATGYRPNLNYLKIDGALNSKGIPLQVAGISTGVSGMYYVGLEGQRSFSSATLRGVGPDAKFVVRKALRYLKSLK